MSDTPSDCIVVADENAAVELERLLTDDTEGLATLFECVGNGGAAAWADANARYQQSRADLCAVLGRTTAEPTRKQGLSAPPKLLDSRWVTACVWHFGERRIFLTLSGGPTRAQTIELCVGASQ